LNYEFVKLIIRLIGGVLAPSSQTLVDFPWLVNPAGKMDLTNSKFDELLYHL